MSFAAPTGSSRWGTAAGEHGGEILYSGPVEGLRRIKPSETRRHLFAEGGGAPSRLRAPVGWLRLEGVTRNNLEGPTAPFRWAC